MFEIGWTEMLVIAVVMIVVVGPKDLPRMLRTFGKTTAKLRAMAGDFQKQFNEALKEAELDDVKKSVDSLRSLNPAAEIRKQLNPFEQAAADVRAGVDAALKPATPAAGPPADGATEPPAAGPATIASAGPAEMPKAPVFPAMSSEPASAVATAAEPLKAGPSALPGEGGSAPAPSVKAAPAADKAAADAVPKTPAKARPAKSAATKAKTTAGKALPAKPKPAPKASATKKNTAGTAK